jgi:hypothetical protein
MIRHPSDVIGTREGRGCREAKNLNEPGIYRGARAPACRIRKFAQRLTRSISLPALIASPQAERLSAPISENCIIALIRIHALVRTVVRCFSTAAFWVESGAPRNVPADP